MTKLLRTAGRQWLVALCLAVAAYGLVGCGMFDGGHETQFQPVPGTPATPAGTVAGTGSSGIIGNVLHGGDTVTVRFSEVDPPIPDHIERIKDDGTLTLGLIGMIPAAGKTPGQLQTEIHDLYVPRYYRSMNVVVIPQDQYFYVGGEVKQPGRFLWVGDTTLLRAIQTAGDFTDFANKSKVRLIHSNGQMEMVNCKKALLDPSLDKPVYPGDRITVTRRFF